MFHTFLDLHLDMALILPDIERHLAERPGDKLAENDGQRCEEQQGPGKRLVHRGHQQESAQQLEERNQQAGKEVRGSIAYSFNIFGQAGGDVPRMNVAVGIELTGEQPAEYPQTKRVVLPGLRDG